MANEKKRGIKNKIWYFQGCEEWRVPIKETEKLGEVLSENTVGTVRLMLRAEGVSRSDVHWELEPKLRLTVFGTSGHQGKERKIHLRKQSDKGKNTERKIKEGSALRKCLDLEDWRKKGQQRRYGNNRKEEMLS